MYLEVSFVAVERGFFEDVFCVSDASVCGVVWRVDVVAELYLDEVEHQG